MSPNPIDCIFRAFNFFTLIKYSAILSALTADNSQLYKETEFSLILEFPSMTHSLSR